MTTTASTRHDPTAEQTTGQSECRLYLITPPRIELRLFHGQLSEALNAGDVACIQLRLKDVSDDVIMGAADTLLPLAQELDIPFLVNDRPDLAVRVGADGVHIGQDDASYEEARALLGDDGIIGISCHGSRHLAMVGAEKGADYVTFGSFFPSNSKSGEPCTDIDLVRWWRDISVVQCAAVGGITPENCTPIISAGVDFLAVSEGIWDYPDGPGAAVQAFCSAIDHAAMEDPVI
ncbi:MAG: thiamine phosphate synthase [Rhodospirillales bacterium]|nr:thiamine phosphate synthase [Rhodospirillales bacterium]